MSSSSLQVVMLLLALFSLSALVAASAGNFGQDFDITWGNDHVKMLDGGRFLTLSLDNTSGSAFQSKNEYLFGRIDMQIKLVSGNSAGTVTTYYVNNIPIRVFNNLKSLGVPFPNSQPMRIYSSLWNADDWATRGGLVKTDWTKAPFIAMDTIKFLVDNIPIRVFNNLKSLGVPFPNSQPMRIYSSLWNADDWATRGGLVKTDWTKAPFIASYRNFEANACVWSSGSSCVYNSNSLQTNTWQDQALDATGRRRIRWVQKKYMIYNYCTDLKRFPQGLPPECKRSKLR
ncbi:xyloglucan endotransglucosylase/hydrolase protein 15 [Quercus suber]|uniref:Xyloglucan endotransglucosylase/hydrolase n=1 Tax=Quercus suber TaxID=58331 RepID=A0AAW0LN43_QUESU